MRSAAIILSLCFAAQAGETGPAASWPRHTIDDSSRGADGVRTADVNGDGCLDMVTGWEEGGQIRVCLNPGPKKAKEKWPSVTVGKVKSPEDAVFVDLDNDGAVDVVSCCEGGTKAVFVHWAPKDRSKYLDEAAWTTEAFPALQGMAMWMFCAPMQVDGQRGVDLVLGAKGAGAKVGWLEAPADPRKLADWKWHPLCDAGWIMSLVSADINGDGHADILVSDRKTKTAGCYWLEHPGPAKAADADAWKQHRFGPQKEEVMFLDYADVDGDGRRDVVVTTFSRKLYLHRRTADKAVTWETISLPFPDRPGTGKGVRVGDIDGDGKPDIVITLGEGQPERGGVAWLRCRGKLTEWDVSFLTAPVGMEGFKPDLIQLIDLEGDGDLDVITTEERARLGVVWYENPGRK